MKKGLLWGIIGGAVAVIILIVVLCICLCGGGPSGLLEAGMTEAEVREVLVDEGFQAADNNRYHGTIDGLGMVEIECEFHNGLLYDAGIENNDRAALDKYVEEELGLEMVVVGGEVWYVYDDEGTMFGYHKAGDDEVHFYFDEYCDSDRLQFIQEKRMMIQLFK